MMAPEAVLTPTLPFREDEKTSEIFVLRLQEVLASPSPASWHRPAVIWHGGEDLEVRLQVLAEGHDRGHVTAAVAVIRCAPDGDDVLGLEVILVTLVHELMGSSDELEVVHMVELGTFVSDCESRGR